MLRRDAADRLVGDEDASGCVRPAYEGRSFGNLPATIGSLLGIDLDGQPLSSDIVPVERVETVVVVVVDGFGFEQWGRHHGEHGFFARLTDRTPVWPLTSVFPSETATAMSTYMTGRTPVEHGLIGWNVPVKNTVIESLPFETKDGVDAGEALGIERDVLREGPSIAEQFHTAGVETRQVVPESIVTGDAAVPTVTQLPYDDLDEFSGQLRTAIDATDGGFVHAYLPHVDAAAHEVGTRGAEYRETLGAVSAALERAIGGLAETATDTLLIVTADHGHVDTTPAENIDLLESDAIADVIETDVAGTPLLGGGGRNVHFYANDTAPERIRDVLTAELGDQALVLLREEAHAGGLFGPGDPSDTFDRQCSDVIVIPREKIVWHGGESEQLHYTGMHGGLHPDEQLVPFAAVPVTALREGP